MSRLRQGVFAAGFILFSSSFAFAQARLGLHVVDSTGQRVGYVLGVSDAAVAINGQMYAVEIGHDGFRPGSFVEYSTASNCSNPLVAVYEGVGASTLFSRAWYTSDGVLHYPTPGAGAVEAVGYARTVNEDGTHTGCASAKGFFFLAPETTSPPPAFTPPFVVTDVLDVTPAPATPTFNDVPTTDPGFQYIEALAVSGITAGCGGGNFCPNGALTRRQMAVFLAKALGL